MAAADLLHRVPVPWGVGGVRITSGAPLPRPDFVDLSSSLLPASSSPLVIVHSHTSDEEVSGSGRGGSVSDQGAMDRMQEEEGGEEEEEEDGMLGWDRVSADPGRPGGIWILGNEGGHFAPDSSGRGDEGARGASVSANLFPLQGPLSSSGPWGSASVGHNSAREEENDDEEQGEAMVGEGGGRDSKRGREEEEEEDGGPSKKSKKPWRAPEQGFVLFYMRAQQVLLDAPELASSIQLARNIGPVMRELVIDEVNM